MANSNNSNIDRAKRRLKRFASAAKQTASDTKKTVKQAAKEVKSTAKKAASSARTVVNDAAAKGKAVGKEVASVGKKVTSDGRAIGKQMTEKLKQLSNQGRPSSSAKATTTASASTPQARGFKAGAGSGFKKGGIAAVIQAAGDIAFQYAHGGWAQVKAAIPSMVASYGSATVGTALGSAIGTALPLPPQGKAAAGFTLGTLGYLGANSIVNYLMEGQPEQVRREVAKGVAQQSGVQNSPLGRTQSAPSTQQQTQAPRMVGEGSTQVGSSQPIAASDIQQIIIEEANRAGVSPALMLAIANQESGFNPNAVGDKNLGGSYGLFQIHKPSHPDYTGDFDPRANAAYASKMMKGLLAKYGGNIDKAIMAYNAGGGNVDRGTIPASTRVYLANVKAGLGRFGNVVPRGQGNDTLASIQNQPLTGQVQADVIAAGTTSPQQQGYPIAYNAATGQMTGGAGSINDYAAALNSFVQDQKSNNAELVKEGMTLNKDALDEQRRFREEAREGTYTPKEAAALYLDYVNKQSQNQPQQIPYDINIDGYWRAVARDNAYASAGVQTNYAKQYLNNAKMAQMLQQAKLTGVSPDMLGQQSEAQMAREKLIADLAGKAMQYGGAQGMTDYAKNIADLSGNNIDLYTELLKANNGNVQKAMEQLNNTYDRLLQNQQETYNTNINSQTDLTKAEMQGVNAANTAKIQGEYGLQGERMKLEDPYNQFKAITTGAQALQYDPAAASQFIRGIDPRILGTVAPAFNPNNVGGLNPQAAPSVGNPVQQGGSLGEKLGNILKESYRKKGSF